MNDPKQDEELLKLSTAIGSMLTERGLTIATAESCTGGLLASILTDIPGSSTYVLGGIVSYSNEAKRNLLGVPVSILEDQGAVSAESAAAMAQGCRQTLGSDIAVAITGIAGPGGGSPEKPLGLTFLHLSAPQVEMGARHVWPHDRLGNKRASVMAALRLIEHYVKRYPDLAMEKVRPHQGEPTLVEAQWREDTWRPQAIWVGKRRYQVLGLGRQSTLPDGSLQLMVEVEGGTRFQLLLDIQAKLWRLQRAWWGHKLV